MQRKRVNKFVEDEIRRGGKQGALVVGKRREVRNGRWRRLSSRRDSVWYVRLPSRQEIERGEHEAGRWGVRVRDERKSAAKVATDFIPDSWRLESAANTTLLICPVKGKQPRFALTVTWPRQMFPSECRSPSSPSLLVLSFAIVPRNCCRRLFSWRQVYDRVGEI